MSAELLKVETALRAFQANPALAQVYGNQVQQLMQRGYQLGVALNSDKIMRRVWNQIVHTAKQHKPIDQEATEIHEAIYHAVRSGSSGGKAPPEVPQKMGGMTTNEYRKYVKDNWGFDPHV